MGKKSDGVFEREVRQEASRCRDMLKNWTKCSGGQPAEARSREFITEDEVTDRLTDFLLLENPHVDPYFVRGLCGRKSDKKRRRYVTEVRRTLKSTFVHGAPTVSLWKRSELRDYRIKRVQDAKLLRDMLAESSSERGQRRAEAEGLERQEDYDAWREEQAAEKAEVRANHMIAMMDQVDRKQFKPLFVFLARCCERANGNARENLASVVTALIAYTKAEKSKVKEVDRVRVPKIGFDDVASYFVEFGLIKSKRALGTRHQWMYWNMPRLAREFFGSENPAKLGPKFYNMKKNELGISDAEWLRRHLGWGAKRVSR